MADFSTHLIGATALGSFAATLAAKALALPPAEIVLLVGACTIGGVLPDIDLEQSTATRLLFTFLGIVASVAWVSANIGSFSAIALWSAGLAIYASVRWPLAYLFGAFTVHRGALHSLLAAVTVTLGVCAASYQLGSAEPRFAWFLGAFAGFGYVIHLIFDELWSVNFAGLKVKRSFGSAIKPVDMNRWGGSFVLVCLAIVASLATPSTDTAQAAALTVAKAVQADLHDILLPRFR